MTTKQRRLFISIPLSRDWRDFFTGFQKEHSSLKVSWTSPENFHLTVLFIGDVPENKVEAVEKAVSLAALEFDPFRLKFERIIMAPPQQQPTMIWARCQSAEEFAELEDHLFSSVNAVVPVKKTHSESIPHITLARFRDFGLKEFDRHLNQDLNLSVERLELLASELTPYGPIYTKLSEFKLGEVI